MSGNQPKTEFWVNPHYTFLSVMMVSCLVTLYFLSILSNRENVRMIFNNSFDNNVKIVQICFGIMIFMIICYLVFEWILSDKTQIRSAVLIYSFVCGLVLLFVLIYCTATVQTLKTQIQKLVPISTTQLNTLTKQQLSLIQETFALTSEAFSTAWFALVGIVAYTILQFCIEYIEQLQDSYSQRHSDFVQQQLSYKKDWQKQLLAKAEASFAEAEANANLQQSEQLQELQQQLQEQRHKQTVEFRNLFDKQLQDITQQFLSTSKKTENDDELIEQVQTFMTRSNVPGDRQAVNKETLMKVVECMKAFKTASSKIQNIEELAKNRILDAAKKREIDLINHAEALKMQNAVTTINSLIMFGVTATTGASPYAITAVALLCNYLNITQFLATNSIKISNYLPTFTWSGWLPNFKFNVK